MAESETFPFFSRLHSLCLYVDSHTTELKEEFQTPYGQKPHNYDRGLRTLKNDVENLKKLSGEVQQKLIPFENFSSHLMSMQELVNQQSGDIDKIEKYLMKFGYTPLPKQETVKQNEVGSLDKPDKSGSSPNRQKEVNKLKLEGTPILSSASLMVAQGKDIPTVASAKPIQPSAIHVETPTSTRIQSKRQEKTKQVYSLSSLSQSSLTVEQWLAGVDTQVELTPDIIPTHKPRREMKLIPQAEKEPSPVKIILPKPERPPKFQEPQKEPKALPCTTPASQKDRIGKDTSAMLASPVEPQFSEYTTSLLSLLNPKPKQELNYAKSLPLRQKDTATPEQPVLSSATSDYLMDERKTDATYTPEEPVISYTEKLKLVKNYDKENCTPEEPVLSYHEKKLGHVKNYNRENCSPEEPVLSYHENKLNHVKNYNRENYTPEEPVLSYKPQNEITKPVERRTPEEPSLSFAKQHLAQKTFGSDLPVPCISDEPASPELSDITRSVLSLSRNPISSQTSRRDTEVSSQKNYLEPCRNERLYLPSYQRNHSHPYSSEQSSYTRSGIERESYRQMYSESADNEEEPRQTTKVAWKRPGVPMEQFLQMDDVLASPQLSDVTQKIIGNSKRW